MGRRKIAMCFIDKDNPKANRDLPRFLSKFCSEYIRKNNGGKSICTTKTTINVHLLNSQYRVAKTANGRERLYKVRNN
jgi:hypothetical protein